MTPFYGWGSTVSMLQCHYTLGNSTPNHPKYYPQIFLIFSPYQDTLMMRTTWKFQLPNLLETFFLGVILNTRWKWLQGHKGVLLRLNICFKNLNNLRSRGQNIMKICSLIIFEPMIPKTIVRSCKNEEKIIYLAF